MTTTISSRTGRHPRTHLGANPPLSCRRETSSGCTILRTPIPRLVRSKAHAVRAFTQLISFPISGKGIRGIQLDWKLIVFFVLKQIFLDLFIFRNVRRATHMPRDLVRLISTARRLTTSTCYKMVYLSLNIEVRSPSRERRKYDPIFE